MEYPYISVPNMTNQSQRPFNLGKVFYVDTYGPSASASAEGTDPNRPLTTIASALAKCTSDQNDYIMVLDIYNADTEPITPTVSRVHIIGINNSPMPYWCVMVPAGDTSVFTFGSSANHIELAGFNLGGGANYGGVISGGANAAYGVWLHNCIFGHDFPGAGTPKYGIYNVQPAGPTNWWIEDNLFIGTTGISLGRIDVSGIDIYGATSTRIINNVFQGCPTSGMVIRSAIGAVILKNRFSMDADTAGAAINLIGCVGCYVDQNSAGFGETDPTNAYSDDSTNANNWGWNTTGDTAVYTT